MPIFVNLAEETYHQRFNVESVFSLLGAFGGLAAVSHILVQDALASPNYRNNIMYNYPSINKIDIARSEFQQKMDALEDRFKAVLNSTKSGEVSEVRCIVCSYINISCFGAQALWEIDSRYF